LTFGALHTAESHIIFDRKNCSPQSPTRDTNADDLPEAAEKNQTRDGPRGERWPMEEAPVRKGQLPPDGAH
jgi:hypothetical protein